ncbi:unnamed protein product [Nippostrongylus brasiliensis]|uniref:Integrase catalytic domain-containing protein n=1 Tax=Nippostrongylus brasiliensis TaxID=27835 RepID=A0A0N4YES2_NIPBR|nr:unnamed protein product [Nippostrongylus brasiliensis]
MTLFCKKLDSTLAEAREVVSNFENQKLAQEKLTAIETFTKKVEEAQKEYAAALDNSERTPSAQEAVDYEQYLAMSEMTLLAAYEVAVQLRALLRSSSSTSKENYTRAIDFLKAKYSDKETILDNLIQRLEATSLQSTSLKDQRILLDHLHVVIAQLRSKGEQVDGQWLVKQVLAKFPQQVQREILRRKCSIEEPFSMQWLLDTLDKYISCEEKIATLIPNDKDASTEAYAACAYLCSPQGASIIMAKARLPSTKAAITIPKLEMSAIRLAARLALSVVDQLTSVIAIEEVLILSDSEIALNWTITRNHLDTTPFVRNRVVEIRNIVTHLQTKKCHVEFGHIASQDNPADVATRGIDKESFPSHIWWKGPSFLSEPRKQWRQAYRPLAIEETNYEVELESPLPIQREEQPQGTNVLAQIATLYVDIFQDIKRAELQSIKRIVAFVLRFIHNTISRHNSKETTQIQLSPLFDEAKPSYSPIPEGLEIKRATKMVAKQHQLAWIAPTTQAALKHLNLYVDHQGILRCRGRLGKSAMSKEAKFPMLWQYITPYAPWQGGVYERLIRSVKLAMYKSLGKLIPTKEELLTLLVEIEAMLNTRPLVAPPLKAMDEDLQDPEYETPAERAKSLTKKQLMLALASSVKNADRFWEQWQHQYLTSLREQHTKTASSKRGSRITPKVGQIVLICDAIQPRHSWKQGRIDELRQDHEGAIREAVITLPSQRKIRRPLNLLVPLELEETEQTTSETTQGESNSRGSKTNQQSTSVEVARQTRYNLRKQPRVDYAEQNIVAIMSINVRLTTPKFSLGKIVGQGSKTKRQFASNNPTRLGKKQRKQVQAKVKRSRERRNSEGILCKLLSNFRPITSNLDTAIFTLPVGKLLSQESKTAEQFVWNDIHNLDVRQQQQQVPSEVVRANEKRVPKGSRSTTYPRNDDHKQPGTNEKKNKRRDKQAPVQQAVSAKPKTQTRTKQEQVRGQADRCKNIANKNIHFSSLDDYDEGAFWERVINNPDSEWPIVKQLLEHLNAQWRVHKQGAAVIVSKFKASKNKDDGTIDEQLQGELLNMLRQAGKEKERLAAIGSRFIAMSIIHKDQAISAGIQQEQLENEIRNTIKEMTRENETLELILNGMHVWLKKGAQISKSRVQQAQQERDDVANQLQNLLAEKVKWQETTQELEKHRDHWRTRAREEEEYEHKWKNRVQEVQQELELATAKNKMEQEALNKRIAQLEQECAHLRCVNSKPGSSHHTREQDKEHKPPSKKNQQQAEEYRRKIRKMERELEKLEEAKRVPPRLLTERSEKMDGTLACAFCTRRGLHFSDNCPIVVVPEQRRAAITRTGRCKRCLDFCRERRFCTYENKSCKYCSKAKNTILELPANKQDRHHTALCSIPVEREQLGERIEKLRDDICKLREQAREI